MFIGCNDVNVWCKKMNNKIQVIDNFLDKESFNKIHEAMFSSFFPWYYHDYVDYDSKQEKNNPKKFQFVHIFYESYKGNLNASDGFRLLQPVIQKLDVVTLIRIKSNLLTNQNEIIQNEFHRDYTHLKDYENAKTAILYMNTNNGKTIFEEDGTEIDSVANRMVIFHPNMKHTGTTCTDQKARVVINFNYYIR